MYACHLGVARKVHYSKTLPFLITTRLLKMSQASLFRLTSMLDCVYTYEICIHVYIHTYMYMHTLTFVFSAELSHLEQDGDKMKESEREMKERHRLISSLFRPSFLTQACTSPWMTISQCRMIGLTHGLHRIRLFLSIAKHRHQTASVHFSTGRPRSLAVN